MKKNITCIECPVGCELTVDIEDSKVIKVSGNKCPKGLEYARNEVENPVRILTSTVLARGLSAKMVPVRTSGPIPKGMMGPAMREIKKARVTKEVGVGDVICKNLLGLGVDLVATRKLGRL